MITHRHHFLEKITNAFEVNSIVALLGPRQCGKTTLAKQYAGDEMPLENYFDLESMIDRERLNASEQVLGQLTGLIIIDEIQRMPELFFILRVLVDKQRHSPRQKFLILGSASRLLVNRSSESLAGRISYLELTPFSFSETQNLNALWVRGGFPRSFLAKNEEISWQWRHEYIRTFLEQDIPNLGIKIQPIQLQRFWMMLTHCHGNIFNGSELGRSLGLSHNTVRQYLDVLTDTLMLRQLQPWHENIKKRQVKSPKIYFRDSGIFHALADIKNYSALQYHPKLGTSWEGLVLEEIIRHLSIDPRECFFWATHAQAELDLLIIKNNRRIGIEIKFSSIPRVTSSMKSALLDLKLDFLYIVYPGDKNFLLQEKISVNNIIYFLNKPPHALI